MSATALPAIKKIAIFGKGMSLLPNEQLPAPPADRPTLCEQSLGPVVNGYVKALMASDYEAIYGMLCSTFR